MRDRQRDLDGLRILMTADAVGGVFTYALTLATALGLRGARVALATMGPPMRPAQRTALSSVDGLVVHESTFDLEWMPNPWDDVARAGDWLLGLERAFSPDIVHLNGYVHAALGFHAPVIVAGHSCVASWWRAVHGTPLPRELARYGIEVRRGLAHATVVLAPTAAMMRALDEHHGPLARRAVVHNGVRIPTDLPTPQRKESIVLAAGRLWDRAKNVAALARVAASFPGPVRLAGDDGGLEAYRAPNLTHLGWLDGDALAREMNAAAIFAHPARYEPFGLCPVEAALRGCALVLGDIASLREVWGDAAVYVAPDDDAALSAALAALAKDEEHRSDHAARARSRALQLTVERMAEGTLAVYRQALDGPPSTTPDLARKDAVSPCA